MIADAVDRDTFTVQKALILPMFFY